MPVTLAEAKVGMADKVNQAVIDEFRRASFILDRLTFDDAVSPGTGGSTLTYGYMKLLTPSTAMNRAINSEYTPNEAKRQKATCDLKVFGSQFQVDRVIEASSGNRSEITFQLQEAVKATRNKFHNDFINGKSTTKGDATAFDGLDKLCTGTSTEYNASGLLDMSTLDKIKANKEALIYAMDEWLSGLAERPDAILVNRKTYNALNFLCKYIGQFAPAVDAFGRKIKTYDDIPLIDMGSYYSGSASVPVIGIDSTKKTTSIYAIKFGMNALHGVSMSGTAPINTYLPDMKAPGAVKKGEVEMVAAIALKDTTLCGALRNIQVEATE